MVEIGVCRTPSINHFAGIEHRLAAVLASYNDKETFILLVREKGSVLFELAKLY